jgi:hypothetical protein
MRARVMYGAGDVRARDVCGRSPHEPTDALVRADRLQGDERSRSDSVRSPECASLLSLQRHRLLLTRPGGEQCRDGSALIATGQNHPAPSTYESTTMQGWVQGQARCRPLASRLPTSPSRRTEAASQAAPTAHRSTCSGAARHARQGTQPSGTMEQRSLLGASGLSQLIEHEDECRDASGEHDESECRDASRNQPDLSRSELPSQSE